MSSLQGSMNQQAAIQQMQGQSNLANMQGGLAYHYQQQGGYSTLQQNPLSFTLSSDTVGIKANPIVYINGAFGQIPVDTTEWFRDMASDSWINKKSGQKVTNQYFIDLYTNKKDNKTKEVSMLAELKNDTKNFIRAHKSVIYWLVILYVADKFLFNGKFKEKLQQITNRLIGKAEAELDKVGVVSAVKDGQ